MHADPTPIAADNGKMRLVPIASVRETLCEALSSLIGVHRRWIGVHRRFQRLLPVASRIAP
jgi:hypothetical protein